MDVTVTVKNYRCFSEKNPARIRFAEGITAFIGPNNSGKSSLLKLFHEIRQIFNAMSTANSIFRNALTKADAKLDLNAVLDKEEIFCNRNENDIYISVKFSNAYQSGEKPDAPIPDSIDIKIVRNESPKWEIDINRDGKPFKLSSYKAQLDSNDNMCTEDGSPIFYYGHIKEFANLLQSSIYIGPYRNAINIGSNADYYDTKVGDAFISQWGSNKTGIQKRLSRQITSVSESIKNIFGFDSLEINASADNRFQISLDGESYNLDELGAGLSQFIIVLGTAATQSPAYIFIDEPELNLHPSLQLRFLTALASYASHGVMFATHSIGLARTSAERIYTVQKHASGDSIVKDLEDTPSLPELLGELSFSAYRELGVDKVLLVEGVTEIKAIQQILRKLGKDNGILILPLGGSSLINSEKEHELAELTRIPCKIYALIDSEKESDTTEISEERKKFIEICKSLNIKPHVLERRALENYWTSDAIKSSFGNKYDSLGPYEKLSDKKPSWKKSENWRPAQKMNRKQILSTDLGKFIDSL